MFLAANLLGEFVGSNANLLAEKTFSLVWEVPRGFSDFVESPHCEISFSKKRFWVLLVRFLRRCLFQVVSLSSRFETTPDLNASKHIKFVVRKV